MTDLEKKAIVEAVVVAADRYVARIEYSIELMENGAGHISNEEEQEIGELDGQRQDELIAAVRAYRQLAHELA